MVVRAGWHGPLSDIGGFYAASRGYMTGSMTGTRALERKMTCYPQSNVDATRAEWRYDITAAGALKSSKWQRLRATPPDAAGAGAGAGCDAAKGD